MAVALTRYPWKPRIHALRWISGFQLKSLMRMQFMLCTHATTVCRSLSASRCMSIFTPLPLAGSIHTTQPLEMLFMLCTVVLPPVGHQVRAV